MKRNGFDCKHHASDANPQGKIEAAQNRVLRFGGGMMATRVRKFLLFTIFQMAALLQANAVLAGDLTSPTENGIDASSTSTEQTTLSEEGIQDDVAQKAQNPVSDLVSVPFQWNLNGGFGDPERFQNQLNIQPVLPIALGPKWNLIQRIILPIYSTRQPREEFGLGDTTASFFLSPSSSGSFTWGLGPVLLLPTATRASFGAGKLGAGPTGVIVLSWQKWVVGFLVNHVWSFAGESNSVDVNQTFAQPFMNFNLPNGFYINTSPILITQWNRPASERWLVPVGLGIGKFFSTGNQKWNGQVAGYWNVVRPEEAPAWTLRFTLTLLFPVSGGPSF